jgi:hypothetical protein
MKTLAAETPMSTSFTEVYLQRIACKERGTLLIKYYIITQDEGTMILQNIGTYLARDTVSHPGKLELSTTLL